MTRKQALEKAADLLAKSENNVISDNAVSKYVTLAQLYLALAHELGLDVTPKVTAKV